MTAPRAPAGGGGAAALFSTVIADPPWNYRNGGPRGGVDAEYSTLSDSELCALPVSQIAAPIATLLLWATIPKLPEALEVVAAWGFTYRSAIVWAKMTRATAPRIGLGYHARSCAELLLIAQRGSPGAPSVSERPAGLFFEPEDLMLFCPIGRHSAKPDYQYDLAEKYNGPYLELFHRPRDGMFPPRPGWVFLGNECPGNLDIREALAQLAEARSCL